MATDHCLPARTLEFQTTEFDSTLTITDVRTSDESLPPRSLYSNANQGGLTFAIPDRKVVLEAVSNLLQAAENELQQLEGNDILGTAVIRACAEIADVVAHVATQLEDQTELERRHFAAAYLQDFQSTSNVSRRLATVEGLDDLSLENSTKDGTTSSLTVAPDVTKDDVMGAMGKVATLLRDVEFSLRAMDVDDASDLADTALIVAQLGLTALRNVHEQMVHLAHRSEEERSTTNGGCEGSSKFASPDWNVSPNIVLLFDDDDDDDDVDHDVNNVSAKDPLQPERNSVTSQRSLQRIRCIWPPITPEVSKFVGWSRSELKNHHWLVTASLGIAFWPLLTATALIGSSAVVADNLLQSLYSHLENTSLVTSAEYAATSVYQSSRLAILSAKAVAKPSLRVAHRQWKRNGPGLHAWAVDKIHHPVQTVGEATRGASWCLQQISGALSDKWNEWQLYHQEQRQSSLSIQSERNKCAQDLHL